MSISKQVSSAIAFGVALALSVPITSEAQTDTTRRAVSEQRIPVRKDQAVVREARGEVALSAEVARITDLESRAAALQARIETLEANNARLTTRTDEMEWMLASLKDSLRFVNGELATARAEFNARAAALSDSVQLLNGRLNSLRYGSIFGRSGFYVGLGSGVNFTSGTFRSIGYSEGANFLVPIGWNKPGYPLGFRTEWGVQNFEGGAFSPFTNIDPVLYTATAMLTLNFLVPIGWSKAGYPLGFRTEWGVQNFEGGAFSPFTNIDPVLYTATAMLTLNFPLNAAKSNLFYLMGGGGAYRFHRIGAASALSDRLDNAEKDVTKWGVLGGAGLEFHILGASSLFVQSAFTNVFANKSIVNPADDSKNLRWIPFTAGIMLR